MVLLVEDDLTIQTIVIRTLQRHGIRCSAVATGQAALEASQTQRPDLLIIDYGLPDMNGAELLGRLSDPPAAILLSGSPRAIPEPEAQSFDRLMGKPFNLDELSRTVQELLKL